MASLLVNTISSSTLLPTNPPIPQTLLTTTPTQTPHYHSQIGYNSTITIPSNPLTPSIPKLQDDPLSKFLKRDYKWGFSKNIDSLTIPKGLSKETVKLISSLKGEPEWMLEFRLKSFRKFLTMVEPNWSDKRYPRIDFQDICYYSAPKNKPTVNSLKEADPELLKYFDKLGISLNEKNRLANVSNSNVAVDAVLDNVLIATTHRKTLEKAGVIFRSISDATKEYPELLKKYFGRVVSCDSKYYVALNSAAFIFRKDFSI